MVKHHVGHGLVELYLVSYGIVDVDVDVDVQEGDAEEDEDYERNVVFRKDAFWDDVLSDDTDGHADDSDYEGRSLAGSDGEDSTRVGVEESVGDDEPNEMWKTEVGKGMKIVLRLDLTFLYLPYLVMKMVD
ncbi:hypothetical protein SLA2020_452830 [Shorea laevis]